MGLSPLNNSTIKIKIAQGTLAERQGLCKDQLGRKGGHTEAHNLARHLSQLAEPAAATKTFLAALPKPTHSPAEASSRWTPEPLPNGKPRQPLFNLLGQHSLLQPCHHCPAPSARLVHSFFARQTSCRAASTCRRQIKLAAALLAEDSAAALFPCPKPKSLQDQTVLPNTCRTAS